MAYSSLIPVIDGGVSFDICKEKLMHGMYRAQTVGPGRACLDCLGALNTKVQRDRDGMFDDPSYIEKYEKYNEKQTRQNIMPFSFGLASLETIQFVEMMTNLANIGDLGQQAYNYHTGEILPNHILCNEYCKHRQLVAMGDSQLPVLGTDQSRNRETSDTKTNLLDRPS